MAKSYIAIAAIIFAVVAMSVSWAALVVSAALAVWGAVLLRR
jgi:hypothetical protein